MHKNANTIGTHSRKEFNQISVNFSSLLSFSCKIIPSEYQRLFSYKHMMLSHRISFDIIFVHIESLHFTYHSNFDKWDTVQHHRFGDALFLLSHFENDCATSFPSMIKHALAVVPYIYRWGAKKSTFCSRYGNDEKKFSFFHKRFAFFFSHLLGINCPKLSWVVEHSKVCKTLKS